MTVPCVYRRRQRPRGQGAWGSEHNNRQTPSLAVVVYRKGVPPSCRLIVRGIIRVSGLPTQYAAIQVHRDANANHTCTTFRKRVNPTLLARDSPKSTSRPSQPTLVRRYLYQQHAYHCPTTFHRTPPSTGESNAYSTIHSRINNPPISLFCGAKYNAETQGAKTTLKHFLR